MCITKEQIQELEQQEISVQIEQYQFDLREKMREVNKIVEDLIKKLCALVPLSQNTISMNDPNGDIVSCNDPSLKNRESFQEMDIVDRVSLITEKWMIDECERNQDDQLVKFLKKRHEFISIDMKYIKTNINIYSFKKKEDQELMLFCIIILKNANNLILELGPFSFMQFVIDIKD